MASFLKEMFGCLILVGALVIQNAESAESKLDAMALRNFIKYLKIPSVQPNVNYDDCVTFLKKQAQSLDLPVKVLEMYPKKPIVIFTWEGTEPEKPSILLNGHMDVVPVISDEWKYPPFDAHIDEKGNIYARGSQDMKSASIQHIEAIRRLKLNGTRLKRTIHISFVPDEEIGGTYGMESFVKSQDFKDLNVGFALDEGAANEGNKFYLTYGERTVFQIWVHCTGEPGHALTLPDNTASEKLRIIIDRYIDFRTSEKDKLKDPAMQLGNVTSINLTMLRGGSQVNVLPNELSAAFDIRIPPGVNHTKFKEMIEGWFKEAGEGVNYTIIYEGPPTETTKLDNSNIYWLAFKKACDDNGLELEPCIQPGATDIRHLRALGIPALGFSPMNNTPGLAHANNEYLNKHVFLKGINIFMNIIKATANI